MTTADGRSGSAVADHRPAGTPAPARGPERAAELEDVLRREEEKLLACVHCGFCLPACPTYTRLGDEADSPRGRLHLMRAVVEGRIEPDAPAFGTHIDRCLGCRACETVCPSGVEYGALLERARALIAREVGTHPAARVLLAVFGRRPASRAALAAGRVLRRSGLARSLARRLPARFARTRFALAMLAATAPDRAALAPAPATAGPGAGRTEPGGGRAAPSMRAAVDEAHADRAAPSGDADDGPPSTVGVLTGCVQDGLFAPANRATVRVLRANGFRIVEVPGQRCCGALHAHAGELGGARALARRNVDAFHRAGVEHIVVNAAGCGAVMKEYAELLADDPDYAERARDLTARVRDLFELLAETGVRAGAALPLRVTYDAPCHLHHAQRVTDAPVRVIEGVPGLEPVPLPGSDECCGGAGIYGLLHPDLGGRILRDKVAAVRSTGADAVVTPNPGCVMQIGAGLLLAGDDTPVIHPVELLDESYRRAGMYDGTD